MGAGSPPFSRLRTIHPTDFINSSWSILLILVVVVVVVVVVVAVVVD